MDMKKARALVDSREKLDPDYAKAVKLCIKDDEVVEKKEDSPKEKVK